MGFHGMRGGESESTPHFVDSTPALGSTAGLGIWGRGSTRVESCEARVESCLPDLGSGVAWGRLFSGRAGSPDQRQQGQPCASISTDWALPFKQYGQYTIPFLHTIDSGIACLTLQVWKSCVMERGTCCFTPQAPGDFCEHPRPDRLGTTYSNGITVATTLPLRPGRRFFLGTQARRCVGSTKNHWTRARRPQFGKAGATSSETASAGDAGRGPAPAAATNRRPSSRRRRMPPPPPRIPGALRPGRRRRIPGIYREPDLAGTGQLLTAGRARSSTSLQRSESDLPQKRRCAGPCPASHVDSDWQALAAPRSKVTPETLRWEVPHCRSGFKGSVVATVMALLYVVPNRSERRSSQKS
eukprot:gene9579-biopygen22736